MIKFKNLASSLLATSINNVVTTVVLTSGDEGKFPSPGASEWTPILLVDGSGNTEIMKCTARSGVNLTVVRGQEGTTALSFTAGARVEHRLTAAALEEIQTDPPTALAAGLATKEPTISAGAGTDYWRGDKTWAALNKAAVGLGNVDNTTDANKPVSTATQTALNLKAPLANPTFTGVPAGPTATPGTNTTQLATTAYADAAAAAAITAAYGKVVRRLYTSGATWTKPTGLVKVVVTVVGAGGGGGGAATGNAAIYHIGGPGAGGGIAVSEVLAASLGATETITIGAGGTAGSTGGSSGGVGGTTSFGAHAVATGGPGGQGSNAGSGTNQVKNDRKVPGVGTTGNIYKGYGNVGQTEYTNTSENMRQGGASPIAFGAVVLNVAASDTAVNAEANSGAGGMGAYNVGNTGGRVGAVGGSGLVIVEEYYV